MLSVCQVGVITVLYLYVFSSESQTSYFNRAADRLKKDPRCIELLGDGKKIEAYTSIGARSRWTKRSLQYGALLLAHFITQ